MTGIVEVACWACDGEGFTLNPDRPGVRIMCGVCGGSEVVEHVLNCDHDLSSSGYGDVDDPQWDGAWQCDECGAVFAEWPRAVWGPRQAHYDRPHCLCGHLRADHRRFADSCIAADCSCELYAKPVDA